MTIAPPYQSRRGRETFASGSLRNHGRYDLIMNLSAVWADIDPHRDQPSFAFASVEPRPITVDEIRSLFSVSQFVDVAPSDNDTTYVEWSTDRGFVSLEVGHTRFAFSFIPESGSSSQPVGESGMLTERSRLEALIRTHS